MNNDEHDPNLDALLNSLPAPPKDKPRPNQNSLQSRFDNIRGVQPQNKPRTQGVQNSFDFSPHSYHTSGDSIDSLIEDLAVNNREWDSLKNNGGLAMEQQNQSSQYQKNNLGNYNDSNINHNTGFYAIDNTDDLLRAIGASVKPQQSPQPVYPVQPQATQQQHQSFPQPKSPQTQSLSPNHPRPGNTTLHYNSQGQFQDDFPPLETDEDIIKFAAQIAKNNPQNPKHPKNAGQNGQKQQNFQTKRGKKLGKSRNPNEDSDDHDDSVDSDSTEDTDDSDLDSGSDCDQNETRAGAGAGGDFIGGDSVTEIIARVKEQQYLDQEYAKAHQDILDREKALKVEEERRKREGEEREREKERKGKELEEQRRVARVRAQKQHEAILEQNQREGGGGGDGGNQGQHQYQQPQQQSHSHSHSQSQQHSPLSPTTSSHYSSQHGPNPNSTASISQNPSIHINQSLLQSQYQSKSQSQSQSTQSQSALDFYQQIASNKNKYAVQTTTEIDLDDEFADMFE